MLVKFKKVVILIMNEEYLIAKLVQICGISYNFAQSIVMDLENRNLLSHLKLNIDKYEDYLDIHNNYYRNYLTEESRR